MPQPSEDPMRVVVDFDRCQSNALCMSAAPDIFEVRDDGFLYVLVEEPGDEQRAAIESARELCPTQAISVEG
jgi:ferredoxin